MNIKDKIYKITGVNRIKDDDIKSLESFLENFSEDEAVDAWLNKNWDKAKLGDENEKSLIINNGLNLKIKSKKGYRLFIKPVVAASIVAFVFVALWYYPNKFNTVANKLKQPANTNLVKERNNGVVLKKGKKSYDLTHSDINISNEKLKVVGTQDNLILTVTDNSEREVVKQEWSTLKVPRRKDYYVILADGTQVWMNADSELTFPDFFLEGKREVSLKGEAYFIVKSDVENPFYVKTLESTVEVTGTKFNVCSYANEQKSMVTLVEGKVGVETKGKIYHIKPREQFVLDKRGGLEIRAVDPYYYISWIDGIFEFNDMTLYDMSLRLKKWYDIEFEFKDESSKNERFTGMVKKESDINYFIQVLAKTTNLKFSLQESKIIVKQK